MMAIRVECTCGKAFDVPDAYAGKSGKCKGCGAKFSVPMPPVVGPPPVILEQPPEPAYATTVFVGTKQSRSRWVSRVAIGAVSLIVGAGAGLAIPRRKEVTTIYLPAPAQKHLPGLVPPQLDYAMQAQAEADRVFNPCNLASKYWTATEKDILGGCAIVSARMKRFEKMIFISTIATMLMECGKAEKEWRGEGDCVDAEFCMMLMSEMFEEGTSIEEVFSIMLRVYRERPKDGRPTPEHVANEHRKLYHILKSANPQATISDQYRTYNFRLDFPLPDPPKPRR